MDTLTKVLIVSDSHGLTTELIKVKERHTVDFMVHCGDSELEMDDPVLKDFYLVGGNCDFDSRYPGEQVLELGELKFFIVHGHLHQVKQNLTVLVNEARKRDATIICYGHTHVAGVTQSENQLFINPGSIFRSKGITEETYAILEWENPKEIKVKFYNLSSKAIQELDYTASFA